VFLDAMGVLFEEADDTERLLLPFVRSRCATGPGAGGPCSASCSVGADDAALRDAYRRASLGQLSTEGLWQEVGLGHLYPAIELEYLSTQLVLQYGAIEACRALRASGLHLALLSNDLGPWSRWLRGYHGLSAVLDLAVVSGDLGLRKPDPRIFARALELAGAPAPANCVLVDDRPANLAAAEVCGLQAVQFADPGPGSGDGANWPVARSFTELVGLLTRAT
jgi:HAD superfamily hydrolase (TIGR01509 family)